MFLYCLPIAGRSLLAVFFTSRGAAMLPAQACAKWPPCLLVRAHDGSRRTPNIAAPFDFRSGH